MSYPETPRFRRCRAIQVSPHTPVPSLASLTRLARHFEPTSSAVVCGKRCALPVRPIGGIEPAFTLDQVTRALPPVCRFMVAQPHLESPNRIGSKAGVSPASAQRNAASPIKGTALQRLLGTRLAILFLPVGEPARPFGQCVLQLAACTLETRTRWFVSPRGRPPGMRSSQ